MATEYIYVHLDSVTNHVLSKGMDINHFQQSLRKIPKNILLLDAKKVSENLSHIQALELFVDVKMFDGIWMTVVNSLKKHISGLILKVSNFCVN